MDYSYILLIMDYLLFYYLIYFPFTKNIFDFKDQAELILSNAFEIFLLWIVYT